MRPKEPGEERARIVHSWQLRSPEGPTPCRQRRGLPILSAKGPQR
jgi:hypothetical protein